MGTGFLIVIKNNKIKWICAIQPLFHCLLQTNASIPSESIRHQDAISLKSKPSLQIHTKLLTNASMLQVSDRLVEKKTINPFSQ